MRRIRFIFFYLLAFLKRYYLYVAAAIFLLIITAFIIYSYRDSFFRASLSEGIVGTFTQDNLPFLVSSLLSRGLVAIDQTGSPVPDLAESWTSNDESKVFTFKLKDNLYWSDGTRIKASDIELSFPDVTIATPDDRTVYIKLNDSFSPFPTLLTKPLFKRNSGFMGTGPYKVASVTKDIIFIKRLTLKSNDKNLPNLTLRFYPSERIAKTALKIGEVHSILGISDPEDLGVDRSFDNISQPNYNRLVTIFYDTSDPILSDVNFRLALSFAAPSLPGEVEAKSSISPLSWAYNPAVKDYLDKLDQAQSYLSKVQNFKDQTITLTSTSSLKDIGEQVVQFWNRLGIKAVLRVESGIPQNFQALLISQKIPPDPDQYSLWHKLGQTNVSKFSNPRIDKDLEDGRKLKDIEARKQKYQDFQKILLDNAPATFLYFPKYNVLYLKKKEAELKKILEYQQKAFQ